jgi:hypothetical protein
MILEMFYSKAEQIKDHFGYSDINKTLKAINKKRGSLEPVFNLVKQDIDKELQKSILENNPQKEMHYALTLENFEGIIENCMPIFEMLEGFTFDANYEMKDIIEASENY